MIRLFAITSLSLALGCTDPMPITTADTTVTSGVQLFNESVLSSAPTDSLPMLLPCPDIAWTPRQVILDYKDNACYGAMVHYDRTQSFEALRDAMNSRFGKHEQPTFANDPTMGIWRMDDAGFTIQLTDDEEEDSYMAIYILFVDPLTMADKLDELSESDPELFDDFPLDCFTDGLRNPDQDVPEIPDGG